MSFQKISAVIVYLLAAVLISACNPSNIRPNQTEADNNLDNVLNMLDPEVTTEEQAFAKAEAAAAQGKADNALFYYIKTLQYNPKNIKALEKIADIHKKNKNPELAIKVYQQILTIDSQNVPANEYLGLYFLDNGQIGKAKNHLAIVAKNNSNSWKAHNGLGVIADLAHNTNEAITHYEAALTIEPANPMLLNNLGYSYYLAGDELKAKQLLSQALNYDSKYERAIHNLALIYIKNGNISNAVALFNRIMPAYDTYNNIGYISMLNGRYAVAEEYLRRAIDESPVYFPKAQDNLNTLLSLKTRHMPVEPSVDSLPTPETEIEIETETETEAPIISTPSQSENVESEDKEATQKGAENQIKTSNTAKKKPVNNSKDKPPPLSYPFSSKPAVNKSKRNSKEVNNASVKKTEKNNISSTKKAKNSKSAKSNELKPTPPSQTKHKATQQEITKTVKAADDTSKPATVSPENAQPEAVPSAATADEKPQPPVFIKKAPPKPDYKFNKYAPNGNNLSDVLPSATPPAPGQSNSKFITDLSDE